MGLMQLSDVLWQERHLLELLLFKLEEEQMILTSGRTRWLGHATREVETVLDDLMSVHGIPRDVVAPSAADQLKLEGPAIPGVTPNAVTDQSAIDDLMAGLGL